MKRKLGLFAIYPGRTLRAFKNLPTYFTNYQTFKRLYDKGPKHFKFVSGNPQLLDRDQQSGTIKGHYFHQDLLVAKRIFQNDPVLHVDIGSRIDGFVAHVASFRKIEVFDIRQISSQIYNVTFKQLDLMEPLATEYIDYCDSLSCLHALEHFGLGRYGDKIDPDGYLTGLDNLIAMLKTSGTLYLSVPIGQQRIEFDAHRVFSATFFIDLIEARGLRINKFSFVDDQGDLHEDERFTRVDAEQSFGCRYGCGIAEATKV